MKFKTQEDKNRFLGDHPNDGLDTIYNKSKLNTPEQIYEYCKICHVVKPERTHHCRVCNRCVLKMDHHCPWVGNCVGFGNHKFFFLFCMHASLGCLSLGFFLVPRLIETFSLETLLTKVTKLIGRKGF